MTSQDLTLRRVEMFYCHLVPLSPYKTRSISSVIFFPVSTQAFYLRMRRNQRGSSFTAGL